MKNVHYTTLLCVLRLVTAELLTLPNLESFLRTQRLTVLKLENYVKKERDRIDIVKRLVNKHKAEERIASRVPQYMENPYRAFPLIRRLTTDLNFIHKMARQTTEFVIDKELTYPGISDLQGAINTILTLQEAYNFNVTNIADGHLLYKSTPLNVDDCYTIATIAYHNNKLQVGVEWMVATLAKFHSATEHYGLSEIKLVEYIALGYQLLNNTRNALYWTQRLVELDPNDPKVPQRIKYIDGCEKKLNWEEFQKKYGEPVEEAEKAKFSPILAKYCAKQMLHTTKETDRYNLKCFYMSVTHYLIISRMKLELLHPRPVIMFHDVITDAEIDHLIALSTNRLRPTSAKVSPDYKSSSIAYVNFNESSILSSLNRRIAYFTTGVQSHQPMRIIRYGLSGYYQPFVNETHDSDESFGEKRPTVTAMIYMSDIKGGATVFPFLGLTVHPVKRAALVWIDSGMAATTNSDSDAQPFKFIVKSAKEVKPTINIVKTVREDVHTALNLVRTTIENANPTINVGKTGKEDDNPAINLVKTARKVMDPAINIVETTSKAVNPAINIVKAAKEAVNSATHIVCPVLHGFSWVAINSLPWYHHPETRSFPNHAKECCGTNSMQRNRSKNHIP